jgi:hypothetical protein
LVGGSVILIGSLASTFVFGFWQSMYYHTDYKNYSLFVFPTRGMMDAYQWLSVHTPRESTVIAGYEAANNILLFSHNFVVGNKEGWPEPDGSTMEKQRDAFYLGYWDAATALKYLKESHVDFVYKGYQEPDGFAGKYGFLKTVFRNSDTTIYEVVK